MVLALDPGGRLVKRSLVDAAGNLRAGRIGRVELAMRVSLQLDACPIGEHGQGLGEIDPFHFHDEAEDVPADVAGPALPRLPLGIDLETGPGVVVPGAEGHVAAALAAKLQVVLAQQIDDIDRLSNLFLSVKGRVEGQLRLPSGVRGDIHFANEGAGAPLPCCFCETQCGNSFCRAANLPPLTENLAGGFLHGGQIIAPTAKRVNENSEARSFSFFSASRP